ncbi:MAG: hypothetical protein AB9856_12425 [Cellulosilyticaceae bacterium]
MDVMACLKTYQQGVKQTPYLYEVQKKGINLFESFIMTYYSILPIESLDDKIIEEFLVLWLPKHKRYLTEIEAYDIVYTTQSMYLYILKKCEKAEPKDSIVELYAKEYMRLYRVRSLFNKILEDPVINMNPGLISLDAYTQKRAKKKEGMCTYEQGVFQIQEICLDGYITLKKIDRNVECKVLVEPSVIKHIKKGDVLHARLKRKVFFIYWEIDEIFHYYLDQAINYL